MLQQENEKNPGKVTTTTTTTTTVETVVTTTEVVDKKIPLETYYILLLDKSGSMGSVRQATLDGLNEQLQEIKKLQAKYPEQKYKITINTFDSEHATIFNRVDAEEVKILTNEDYVPDGMTALYDSIGFAITEFEASEANNRVKSGDAEVIVVILTDGIENKSKEFTSSIISELIGRVKATNSWIFNFMGASESAVLDAKNIGIDANNVLSYASTSKGTKSAFGAVTQAMNMRGKMSQAGVYTSSVNFMSNAGYSGDIPEDIDATINPADNTNVGA